MKKSPAMSLICFEYYIDTILSDKYGISPFKITILEIENITFPKPQWECGVLSNEY